VIGIKVWIFKGEVFDQPEVEAPAAEVETAAKPAEAAAPAG
jgi:ribosomal protein S3